MNRWEGRGGLVRDPEIAFLEGSGVCVWRSTIAVNGTRYDSQSRQQVVKTSYVSVSVFGYQAEQLAEVGLTRGDEIHVVGEIDQREITREDGTKERKTGVTGLVVTPLRVRSGGRQSHQPEPIDDPWGPGR